MFVRRDPGPQLTVNYWLPITKVNVTGSVVTATRVIDKHFECRPTPAVVSVVTRPDYSHAYQLAVKADNWATHHAKIDLLADARLASADASNKSGRATALKNILGFAAAGAGIGAAAGPAGALFGLAGGLVAGTAALGVSGMVGGLAGVMGFAGLTDEAGERGEAAKLPDYAALGILPEYAKARSDDAGLLAALRVAESKGRVEFASTVNSGTGDPQAVHQRLRLIRTELALSETLYQEWLNSILITTTAAYDEEIAIKKLPGTGEAGVKAWYDNDPDSGVRSFHQACKALGIAVGFRYEPSAGASSAPPAEGQAHSLPGAERPVPAPGGLTTDDLVHYRELRPGVLRVYAVIERDGKAHELRVRNTQRILVAAAGNEKAVPLLAGKADRSMTVAFDPAGALTSISTDVAGPGVGAADALGALPGVLKDAFTAGTELGTPFSAQGRAASLKAQVDEKSAREDLSARADPNKQLKDDLARAELEARLKAANDLANGGTSTAVVIMGGVSG